MEALEPSGDPAATDDVAIGTGSVTVTSGDAGITVNSISLGGSGVPQFKDPRVTQSEQWCCQGWRAVSDGAGQCRVPHQLVYTARIVSMKR
jgi:hypothetical protein